MNGRDRFEIAGRFSADTRPTFHHLSSVMVMARLSQSHAHRSAFPK